MDKQTEHISISGSGSYLLTAKSSEIELIWEKILPYIELGIGVDYTVEQVREMLINAEAQLWMSVVEDNANPIEAVLITQTFIQNESQVCLLFICAGQLMDHWLEFLEQIEDWAIAVGCDKMEIVGRRGWLKKLPEYKEKATIIEKSLWKKKILMPSQPCSQGRQLQ